MIPLTNKEYVPYHNQQTCYICKEKFIDKYTDD